MNSFRLLVIASIVLSGAAQDTFDYQKDRERVHGLLVAAYNEKQEWEEKIAEVFADDEIIEYTTSSQQDWESIIDEALAQNEVLEYTSPRPETTNNYTDFVDWDSVNTDDSVYEDYNEITNNELGSDESNVSKPQLRSSTFSGFMKPIPSSSTFTTFTMPDTVLLVNPDVYDMGFNSRTNDNSGNRKITTEASPVFFIDRNIYELPTTARIETTATSGDSGEITDGDGGIPVTDEPDYSTEVMDDPCNYDRYEHPLPPIMTAGRRVSDKKCDEYMWRYKIDVLDSIRNAKECTAQMIAKKQNVTEIVGGVTAKQGDFPHMGAVGWIKLDGGIKWMCGSSLISPWFTVTAAHCRSASSRLPLRYKHPKVIRFGRVFLEGSTEESIKIPALDVEIEEFIVLKEYAAHPKLKYNDIGLIRLKKEVKMNVHIKPACLWTGYLGNKWVANVTGWGQTSNSVGSESDYLRYAEVDFVEKKACNKSTEGRNNRHWLEGLKDHQFCAGKTNGGTDACQGDSGGPIGIQLPMPMPNSTGSVHHVVGITSFGIQCAAKGLPGVYTNITSFLCWVEKTVWANEINTFCP